MGGRRVVLFANRPYSEREGVESRMNTTFRRSPPLPGKPTVVVGVGLVLWVLWLVVLVVGGWVVPESFCSLCLDFAYKRGVGWCSPSNPCRGCYQHSRRMIRGADSDDYH